MEYTRKTINAFKIIPEIVKERNYNLGINWSTILKRSSDEYGVIVWIQGA
jgi:hypothetical protein